MSKVRVAILGCGGVAARHAQRLGANPDVQIVGLCDSNATVAYQLREENLRDYEPEVAVFTDAAQMYAAAQPDAVVIGTPHVLHFEHGMQALEDGCHILMEKPMVINAGHAHILADAVRRHNKILVIGYNTPCTPNYRFLRDIIRSGELGNLQTVSGWQAQNWKDLFAGTWRQDPAIAGGGQLYDGGAHFVNSVLWCVEQPFHEVQAFIDNSGTPVDINSVVNIRFANGVMASLTIAGGCGGESAQLLFGFQKGAVEIDGWYGQWIKVHTDGSSGIAKPEQPTTSYTPDDNFIDAILRRAEPLTSPANGIIQSELMDAIYESARTGKVVRSIPAQND